jgi:hypothetical protein
MLPAGGGRFRGDLPAGELLVVAQIAGFGPNSAVCAVCIPEIGTSHDVVVAPGTLSVDLPIEREHEPRPLLRLVEIDGVDLTRVNSSSRSDLSALARWNLPRKEQDHELVFFSIPANCVVELNGFDKNGGRFRERIAVAGSTARHIVWP